MIASIPLDDASGTWEGPLKPSTEWRFHHKLLRGSRGRGGCGPCPPDLLHDAGDRAQTDPRLPLHDRGLWRQRCALRRLRDRFGTEAAVRSSRIEAMKEPHGVPAGQSRHDRDRGERLPKAMWRAVELETIARSTTMSLLIGGPVLLSDGEIDETHKTALPATACRTKRARPPKPRNKAPEACVRPQRRPQARIRRDARRRR